MPPSRWLVPYVVLAMTTLISFRYEDCYPTQFKHPSHFNPSGYLKDYDRFFEGPSFKLKVYDMNGFAPAGGPIFSHPKGLNNELRALEKHAQTLRLSFASETSSPWG